MMGKTKGRGSRRGIFLTLDVSVALMLTLTVVILAFAYFGRQASTGFDSAVLRSYAQDAANVLAKRGCLHDPLDSGEAASLACTSEVLRATPQAACFQLSIYRVLSDGRTGIQPLEEQSLVYAVDKPGCTYFSGPVQTVSIPVAHNSGQAGSQYFHAVVKAWQMGVRQ